MVNPLSLISEDRERAHRDADPLADRCFFATVQLDGGPAVRTLVLRDVESRLAVFFNKTSPKFEQAQSTLSVEVLLWYPSISIQYRLRSQLEEIEPSIVHDQWRNKLDNSRRVDHLYSMHAQSSIIPNRRYLEELVRKQSSKPNAPDSVIGFYLVVQEVERLNLATEDGIHHREKYILTPGGWEIQTLMP